jgi:hypothetical protein
MIVRFLHALNYVKPFLELEYLPIDNGPNFRHGNNFGTFNLSLSLPIHVSLVLEILAKGCLFLLQPTSYFAIWSWYSTAWSYSMSSWSCHILKWSP